MTKTEKQSLIVSIASSYIGTVEGMYNHQVIVNIYNNISPLPVGYKLKLTDPWCAAFVSVVMRVANIDFPYECSCERMRANAVKMGLWEESDNYKPKIGDVVIFDWQDSGNGDNKGFPDHAGIVVDVSDGMITTIEGNTSNRVGSRKFGIDSRYIRGFINTKIEDDETDEKAWIIWAKSKGYDYSGHWDDEIRITYSQLFEILYNITKG